MKIRVIHHWPFRSWAHAVTFPPVGTFIRRSWWVEAPYGKRSQMIRHERVHWDQYRRLGLLGFWARYLWGRMVHGYHNHPMEIEAREKSTR